MASKLNKLAYEKLIEQDLEWLNKQERTLERQHVECIVRESTFFNYDLVDLLNEVSKCDLGEELTKKVEALIKEMDGPHGA